MHVKKEVLCCKFLIFNNYNFVCFRVFLLYTSTYLIYILGQIFGYFREHGPRLFIVILYTYFILSYILYTTVNIFPFIPLFIIIFHKTVRHTVSNALRKAMKPQQFVFPIDWSKNKWSVVEFPFRKALWLKDINAISLFKNVNLSWRMEVNNFSKQLINVIALKLSRSKLLSLFLYTGWYKWLTPLSTIFQLYPAVVWWMTSEYPEKTTNLVASHWQTVLHNVVHIALLDIRTHNISGVFLIDLWELTKTRVSHPSYLNIDSTEIFIKTINKNKERFLAFISLFLIPMFWRNSHCSSFKRDCFDQMNFPYQQEVHREILLISNPISK